MNQCLAMEDTIPDSMWDMTNMLNIQKSLGGTISPKIGRWTNATILFLHLMNNLTSKLPTRAWTLDKLGRCEDATVSHEWNHTNRAWALGETYLFGYRSQWLHWDLSRRDGPIEQLALSQYPPDPA
jgi:hypothetical protein